MNHPPSVGVGDGLAHVDESAKELSQFQGPLAGASTGGLVRLVEAVDGLLETVAADEAHGVERPTLGVVSQAVDRDDAGVL